MSNEVSLFKAGELSMDNLMAGIKNSLVNAPRVENKQGVQYLRMMGADEWVVGKDKDPVAADDEFVVIPSLFTHGYVAWHGGRPEFQTMIPTSHDLSTINLPDPSTIKAKNGIEDARGMVLAGLDSFAGTRLEYTVNSRGGREAIEGLMEEIVARGSNVEDGSVFPVIRLKTDGYVHKEHGPITKPVFDIVDWMTEADVKDALADASEAEPEATEAEPEVEEAEVVEETAAPRRRRR